MFEATLGKTTRRGAATVRKDEVGELGWDSFSKSDLLFLGFTGSAAQKKPTRLRVV